MTERVETSSLFFGEGPLRQMLAVLCRAYSGKAILADGDDELQRAKAVACARENSLPLVLITAQPDCPLPQGIRASCLLRPFLFSHLRELLDELCGPPADPPPKSQPTSLQWERENRILRYREQTVSLTERESALFDALWCAAPGCVSEGELRAVFHRTEGNGPQVYITYLRRKLKQLPLNIHIASRRGEGYALLIPDDPPL